MSMPESVCLASSLGVGGSYPRIHFITPDEEQCRAKVWLYPDGGWELLAVRMEASQVECTRLRNSREFGTYVVIPTEGRVIRLKKSNRCPALVLCDQIMTQASNARRAAVKCRRLARNNSMRYMTTLTFPTSVPGGRAVRISLFQEWLSHSTGGRLFRSGYLMFPEPHKSGSFHLHVLHPNRLDASTVRSLWSKWLISRSYTLPHGCRFVRTHQKDWGSAVAAAGYASKYVSKMFSTNLREQGRRRYYPSLGLSDGVRLYRCADLVTMGELFRGSKVYADLAYLDPPVLSP